MDLKGKSAIVTGGSLGIGTAIAKKLGSCGANVALNYRKHDTEAKAVVAELEKMGVKGLAVKADVSSFDDAQAMVNQVVETFGIKMSRVTTQHGDYIMITEDLFEGDEVSKMGFVVDMNNFAYVYLQGRDTQLRREILANVSDDAVKEEWLSEFSFQRILERTHSLWENVA